MIRNWVLQALQVSDITSSPFSYRPTESVPHFGHCAGTGSFSVLSYGHIIPLSSQSYFPEVFFYGCPFGPIIYVLTIQPINGNIKAVTIHIQYLRIKNLTEYDGLT